MRGTVDGKPLCMRGKKKTCCQEFRSAKRDPVRFQTICSAWALWLVGLALTTPVQDQQHFHINKLLCQCFIYTSGVCTISNCRQNLITKQPRTMCPQFALKCNA